MDLLDILLARKMALADIGKIEGGLPTGGDEGYLLAQGADGPIWIDPSSLNPDVVCLPNFGIVIETTLADAFAGKTAGLYSCKDGNLTGICSVLDAQNGWAFAFDSDGVKYQQFVKNGVATGWQREEEIIFNAGGAADGN